MTSVWWCASPLGVLTWALGGSLSSGCKSLLESVQPLHALNLASYFPLLAGTIALEVPFWMLWKRRRDVLNGLGLLSRILVATAANLASHPVFVFFWLRFAYEQRWPVGVQLGVGEACVVVFEGVVMSSLLGSFRRAFAASLAINSFSWSVGLWVQTVVG